MYCGGRWKRRSQMKFRSSLRCPWCLRLCSCGCVHGCCGACAFYNIACKHLSVVLGSRALNSLRSWRARTQVPWVRWWPSTRTHQLLRWRQRVHLHRQRLLPPHRWMLLPLLQRTRLHWRIGCARLSSPCHFATPAPPGPRAPLIHRVNAQILESNAVHEGQSRRATLWLQPPDRASFLPCSFPPCRRQCPRSPSAL